MTRGRGSQNRGGRREHSPLAGQPAPPEALARIPRLLAAYYTERPDPAAPRARRLRHLRPPRLVAARELQRGPHPRHDAGHLRVPAAQRRDGAALPRPGHPRPLRARVPHRPRGPRGATASRCASTRRTATRRRPSISHAILAWNRGPRRPPRRRHRHHALAQPARGRRLQVQPAPRRPRRHRRHPAGSRTAPTRSSRPGSTASGESPTRGRGSAATTRRARLPRRPTSTTSPRVVDLEAIRSAGVRIGVDPLGGAAVDFWERIAERYGLDLDGRQPARRPHLRLHDARLGRHASAWTAPRPTAMASLIAIRDRFDVAFGNDADADRHGIVTPGAAS